MVHGNNNNMEQMSTNTEQKLYNLPFEDTVWIISKQDQTEGDFEKESDGELELWVIVDEKNVFIGAYTRKSGESQMKCVENLIESCMSFPLSWKPRKPKYITITDNTNNLQIDFQQFGINYIESVYFRPSNINRDLNGPVSVMQSCSLCRRRGTPSLFITCNDCKAIYYCGKQCLEKDAQIISVAKGHSVWCQKMKHYIYETSELAILPFTFVSKTTNPEFNERLYKDFQVSYNIYGRGLWRREGPCAQELNLPQFGEIFLQESDDVNSFVLESLNHIYVYDKTVKLGDKVLTLKDWDSYYKWKDLELNCPVAILMQWPLTIYHLLVNLMEEDYPDQFNLLKLESTIKLHIIGVGKELDIILAFDELQILMPDKCFEILMIGNEVSKKLHQKTFRRSRITYTIEKGYYHSSVRPKCHLVIGFNAGLGAYKSWVETIQYLKTTTTPAYFTDYCRYSCEFSSFPVKELNIGTVSKISINPFRSPVRKYSEGNAFPSYSNGFIYCFKYGME